MTSNTKPFSKNICLCGHSSLIVKCMVYCYPQKCYVCNCWDGRISGVLLNILMLVPIFGIRLYSFAHGIYFKVYFWLLTLSVFCGCSLLLELCGLYLSSLISILCARGVSRGNYYGSRFTLVYICTLLMHTRRGKLLVFITCRFKASPHCPSSERRRSKKGAFYARGARHVTFKQPDHSSGFVMKGQCLGYQVSP